MAKWIYLLFISAFFLSCKKSETVDAGATFIRFSGTYQTVDTVTAGETMIYTKYGVITDSAVIKSFLNGYWLHHTYTYGGKLENFDSTSLRIQFTGDNVIINRHHSIDSVFGITPIVQREGHVDYSNSNYLIITQNNLDSIIKENQYFPMSRTSKFNTPFVCYPEYSCTSYPPGIPGYPSTVNYCNYHFTFPLSIRNGDLYLPSLTIGFTEKNPNGSYGVSGFYYTWNKYNIINLNLLDERDTIVTQLREVKMKKI